MPLNESKKTSERGELTERLQIFHFRNSCDILRNIAAWQYKQTEIETVKHTHTHTERH